MKASCESFVSILNTVYEKGIKSKDALMLDQNLYASFWFATQNFVSYALRSKTNGVDENGEAKPGNIYKLEALENLGFSKEDIHADCVIKIIDKLDLVLKQPIEKQKNYCYLIVNNHINDQFRMLPPADLEVLSLQDTVKSNRVAAEDACTYEEIVGDRTYNPEDALVNDDKIAEAKATVLEEIRILSRRPAEVMARLAGNNYLKIEPRNLAKRIIENGYETTFAQIIIEFSEEFDIPLADLRAAITSYNRTADYVKKDKGLDRLLSNDPKVVADQIYHYSDRARGRLPIKAK